MKEENERHLHTLSAMLFKSRIIGSCHSFPYRPNFLCAGAYPVRRAIVRSGRAMSTLLATDKGSRSGGRLARHDGQWGDSLGEDDGLRRKDGKRVRAPERSSDQARLHRRRTLDKGAHASGQEYTTIFK